MNLHYFEKSVQVLGVLDRLVVYKLISKFNTNMKPTKNKVHCKDSDRVKMLFETEKKAENFIRFNKDDIETESGYGPQRSYYCTFCGGWHVTSLKEHRGLSKKEKIFEQIKLKEKKEEDIENEKKLSEEKREAIIFELESQIKELETSEIERFFSENINRLNQDIEQTINSECIDNNLKELRLNLECHYILRKRYGFQKKPNVSKKYLEAKEQEMEELRLWAEKNRKTD